MKNIFKYSSLLMVALAMLMFTTACDDDDDTTNIVLSVTPDSFSYTATGGYKVLNIKTNATESWTITADADWISFTETSGTGYKSLNVQAATNTVTEERSGTITVSDEDESITITVTQEAGEEEEPIEEPVEENIPDDATLMSEMTAVELTETMGLGWNIGNSLDAVGGETAWGNPYITEELILAIKEAGFNTVRIPVAWSQFSDSENFTISETWMARVQQVVDYVVDNDMYAIVNIHWDNGWMQPTYADQEYVNNRLNIMWQQIAINFRDYDYHLLFAGTNEVMVEGDYSEPTEEYYTVQNSFNETFINTVRATGGRNAYRYLVIQGFNTNIDYTVDYATLPEDTVENRMLMEVHYYDPYEFTLNTGNDDAWQWGNDAADASATAGWGNEDYLDAQFQKMKTNFVDNGIGVILGEFGVVNRANVDGFDAYWEYYLGYLVDSAFEHDMVPVYWDNGPTGNHDMGLFNRTTAEEVYPDVIDAMTDMIP
ncbi:endoglucanase [Pustulibacterium marinum]|uniref:Endoglucanase n=1 Tax=Pustulibacterium marinum TaxID=1224947 RepID=A0A1I7I0T6_9FLAO|nr:cellulase family glycosylhydrolase [Pustulibacterium marinum]SFU66525.1 endoglucanase [Pustulibacterium marinum]